MAKKKPVSKDSPKGKKTMPFALEVLDQLLEGCQTPEQMFGADGLLQQLTKALLERSLQAELTHHLGYEKHDPAGHNFDNSRNGTSPKILKGKRGQLHIEVPRNRSAARSQFSIRAAVDSKGPKPF
jgi:putative transposase